MTEIFINSLKELFNIVVDLNKDNRYWFRGHSNTKYSLNPSAYRNLYIYEDHYGRSVEPRLVEDFEFHGDKVLLLDGEYLTTFFNKLNEENIEYDRSLNKVDQYCLAQHYGVWTPMLDWTTDLSVALFFANDKRSPGQDCAIFLLDPRKWNDFATGKSIIFNSDQVIKESDLTPLAMVGKKNDKRMCRQSGNFTVHGHMIWPLEHYNIGKDVLKKIVIPGNVADELNSYLNAFGINYASIYVEDDEKDIISRNLKAINEATLKRILEEKRNKWLATPIKDRGVTRIRIKGVRHS